MENTDVLAGNIHQRVNNIIGQVIDGIAHRNRAGKVAQAYVFVFPVAGDVLVNLAQNRGGIFAIHTVKFLIGSRAQVRVRGAHVAHQLTTGQFFSSPLTSSLKV